MQEHLSKEEFLHELNNREGLIPISIETDTKRIVWLDLEKYHFYEGFFHKSLDMFSALKREQTVSFTTDFDILKDDSIVTDCIYPTGFIFHSGRCGSTLLAKALSRSRENLIISEASPLNSIWQSFTQDGESVVVINDENRAIYRNILLAMARRRLKSYKHLFIKFTSFNIRFFDFIHAIFPDVPAIFLTRNVSDIIRSWEQRLPGWFMPNNPKALQMLTGSEEPDLKKIVESFCQTAVNHPSDILKQIDYKMLKPENLPLILSYFNVGPDDIQMNLMKSQFLFDSKVELNRKVFKS